MANPRVLRCPTCTASLRWTGEVAVIECRYCQSHVVVATGQRTEGAAQAVATKPPPVLPIVLAFGGIMALGIGVSVVSRLAGGGPAASSSAGEVRVASAVVASARLDVTAEQMAQRFGVEASKGRVRVDLADGDFSYVQFGWDETDPAHVKQVYLSYRGETIAPAVLARLQGQLGRTFRPASTGGHQFTGPAASMGASSSLTITGRLDRAGWKPQLEALWTALKGAALGTSDKLDERTRRDVLNLDYPVARLSDVRFDVTVDGAEREVKRVIPGAVSAGERHDVGLGHAWLESARLGWQNEPGGLRTSNNLYFAKEFDFKARREEVERCLTPLLGAPSVVVGDHLAGDVTLDYAAQRGMPRVHITHQLISVSTPRAGRAIATPAGFAQVMQQLDRCGR